MATVRDDSRGFIMIHQRPDGQNLHIIPRLYSAQEIKLIKEMIELGAFEARQVAAIVDFVEVF